MIEITLLLFMTLFLGGVGLVCVVIGIYIYKSQYLDVVEIMIGTMFLGLGLIMWFIIINSYFPMVTLIT